MAPICPSIKFRRDRRKSRVGDRKNRALPDFRCSPACPDFGGRLRIPYGGRRCSALRGRAGQGFDGADVHGEVSRSAIAEVAHECIANGGEGDLAPRYLRFLE